MFQLVKPEVESIPRETWNTVKVKWYFWLLIVVSVISVTSLFFLRVVKNDLINYAGMIPVFGAVAYVASVNKKVRTAFWKNLAELNGWNYKSADDPKREIGIMFRQGHDQKIYHVIEGEIEGRQFKVFNYHFTIGSGKHRQTFFYTVFVFKFNGTFPHIYLNNKANHYDIWVNEKLPVPSEFGKIFSLSAKRGYEIEALEIFTPEVLSKILDGKHTSDIEFVDQRMIIFTDKKIDNIRDLETRIKQALELEDLLDDKLDKFKFHEIGDRPYNF
ncbi:hypothetical protein C4572_02770 [Candidatus Parcubacteria bacterium]|nr:MAG: hypothetical protein C4572_02770 [Candidatus Parcubacteria bacterium]